MVEYVCECCNYKTNKKSTFDTHNVSKKHLEKLGGSSKDAVKSVKSEKSINDETVCSSENSNTTNDSYLTLKIRELENALKLKDLEIKMKDEQIELLKNTIEILKSNQSKPNNEKEKEPESELFKRVVTKPIPISQRNNVAIKTEEIQEKLTPKQIIKNATTNNNDALDIEEFLELIKTSDQTHCTQNVEYFGLKYQLLKPFYLQYIPEDFTELIWSVYNSELMKLEEKQRPIYRINERLHKFCVKSNGVWYNPNDDNMEQKVNEILESFFKNLRNFIHLTYLHVRNPVKYYDGKTEEDEEEEEEIYQNGILMHTTKKRVMSIIDSKMFAGEELSNKEKYTYKVVKERRRRLNQFKEYSGLKDIDSFFVSTAKKFDTALLSSKYERFIIRLANDGKLTTATPTTATSKKSKETTEEENENYEEEENEE